MACWCFPIVVALRCIFVIYVLVACETIIEGNLIGAQLILVGTEYDVGGSRDVDTASAMAKAMGTDSDGAKVKAAGNQYIILNYLAFILPLIGIAWFLHYFCNKDSLGKRRRLVWAMNNMMVYCVVVILFHIYIMTSAFGGAGMTVSLQVILGKMVMCLLFWWWRMNVTRFYRDWGSSNYIPTGATDAVKDGKRKWNYFTGGGKK